MATYKFPMEHLNGVMLHVSTYKNMTVTSMTNDGADYILDVNIPIVPEEVSHLNDGYGLVEVTP